MPPDGESSRQARELPGLVGRNKALSESAWLQSNKLLESQMSLEATVRSARKTLQSTYGNGGHVDIPATVDLVATLETQLHMANQEALCLRRALSLLEEALRSVEELARVDRPCDRSLSCPGASL